MEIDFTLNGYHYNHTNLDFYLYNIPTINRIYPKYLNVSTNNQYISIYGNNFISTSDFILQLFYNEYIFITKECFPIIDFNKIIGYKCYIPIIDINNINLKISISLNGIHFTIFKDFNINIIKYKNCNNCKHGKCNVLFGKCECDKGFIGNECQFPIIDSLIPINREGYWHIISIVFGCLLFIHLFIILIIICYFHYKKNQLIRIEKERIKNDITTSL
ncbi:hypothetical protein ABK040_002207 [Willaertia magna]